MAHWRNGSAIETLRRFAAYGVRAAASVVRPSGPIQRVEAFQANLFPLHLKKEIKVSR